MSYYSLKAREEEIKHNVAFDFFKEYDCRKMIGNIDFSVAIPQDGKELYPEVEYLLWAEAKKGALSNSSFHDAFIQLIFTIGRERTFDRHMPPKFLGAFDAEKIAFIPYSAVMDVFTQNDFDWSETPSNHESKEFKQLKELVRGALAQTGKENENVYFFNFFNDKKELQRFIKRNFVSGRDSIQRMRINHNNFTHIYAKWCKEVKPSIAVDWENVKKTGLLDADFYLADIMSGDNVTLLENLHVLLCSNHYELDRKIDTDGLWASKSVPFNDNMQAHGKFWSKYTRPPKQEYWNKIVERRDLLVPQDVRELFVQFFTRVYAEIQGATLAEFSTLKILQAPNFEEFRSFFQPKLRSLFVVPASTFDNVKGSFPIGFYVWDTQQKEEFNSFIADIYTLNGKEAIYEGTKEFRVAENQKSINDWMITTRNREGEKIIAFMACLGADFQHANMNYILSRKDQMPHPRGSYVTTKNLTEACIYLAVRHCIEATWLNDRDQFLFPNDGWKFDRDFQSDCLAYTLFHGQNRISSEQGENHWIPFTEQQVNAPDNFKSHFLSDFIAGKCAPANAATLFGEEESLIPSEPIVFTPAAQAVMEAGRKIWEYYMTQKKNVYGAAPVNVNASFYDIRAYFQGRDEKGKMKNESEDKTYTSLIKDLRAAQKVLAKQIEKKVYLYGFLKGEVELDPTERLSELERQNAKLRQQLKEQRKSQINLHIDHLDTLHLGDNIDHKF